MGAKEKALIIERCKAMDPETERLFRINAGSGWVGREIRGATAIRKCANGLPPGALGGAVLILNAAPLHAAPPGWADLAGWETKEITPEMVGTKIAQFKMIEVKATGRLSAIQKKMRDLVQRMGGIFEVYK